MPDHAVPTAERIAEIRARLERAEEASRLGEITIFNRDHLAHWEDVSDLLAALDAQQAQIREQAEALAQRWQPIETAPKDGTVVMLYREMPPWRVRGFGYYWKQSEVLHGWVARGFDEPPGELGLAAPTHWQPLPPAPREDGREE